MSNNWKPEKRLEVVAKIAMQMSELPATKRDWMLKDIVDRLYYLATADEYFLDANEKRIVEEKYSHGAIKERKPVRQGCGHGKS